MRSSSSEKVAKSWTNATLGAGDSQWLRGSGGGTRRVAAPRKGGRCNCNAGWEASVYLAREGRKLRRTFAREAEAKTWRADALTAANARSLRTPSQVTVEQAAWLWLEAARTGAVRDRSGHHYKPGTLRDTDGLSACGCSRSLEAPGSRS